MAYADANQTNRKFGAGASVLAIEVGVAWAIVAALGMTITTHTQPNIPTINIPPEPTKPHDPAPQPSSHPIDPAPTRPVDRIIDLGPTVMPTFIPEPFTGSDDGGGKIDIPIPRTSPLPVPTFAPKAARPQGSYASWVTTIDYPASGIRGEHEGTARYKLSIDASGRATGCSVTSSSGFADLDSATCATLMRRARFTPASDETGAKVAGSYNGTVTWRLPEE
jgi:periplasmic protein TonB